MWSPTMVILSLCHSPGFTVSPSLVANLNSPAPDHLVHAIVVLERVHAGNVIVVVVPIARDDSAPLVLLPANCFKENADFAVPEISALGDAEIEHGARTLGHLRNDVSGS